MTDGLAIRAGGEWDGRGPRDRGAGSGKAGSRDPRERAAGGGVDRERVAWDRPPWCMAGVGTGTRARTLRGRREFKLCWLTALARRVGHAVQRASRRPWEEPR